MKTYRFVVAAILFLLGWGKANAQDTTTATIYPNPFCNTAFVSYHLAQADTVTITVYNLLGLVLETPVQSRFDTAGDHLVSFGSELWSAGVYFVRLTVHHDTTISRKAIKGCDVTNVGRRQDNKERVSMFPNPASTFVTIPVQGPKTIVIQDMMGRTIKTIETAETLFSVSDLAAGPYMVFIRNEKGELISRQRFLKIK